MVQHQVFEHILIEELNLNIMTDEQWNEKFLFRKTSYEEIYPGEPVVSDIVYKKQLQIQYNNPDIKLIFYIIRDTESKRVIGNIFIRTYTKSNTIYEENKFVGIFSLE